MIFAVKSSAYNSIKSIEDKIKQNETSIVKLEAAKEYLHSTAECFRALDEEDVNFINMLKLKYEQLEIKENELKTINQTYWGEIEKISSQRKFLGVFELTAYYKGDTTSTGTTPAENKTIAVDPSVIPYGSVVEIEGYGTYIAEDCGGAVKGNIIDIYMIGYENCINFGRRKANVYILQ